MIASVAPDLVVAYGSLFVHCPEHYAVQQRDGSYFRVAQELSLPLLAGHLLGRWTLGMYLLNRQSCCASSGSDSCAGGAGLALALCCGLWRGVVSQTRLAGPWGVGIADPVAVGGASA